MKIVQLGRCIDNKDVLGVGRIRVEYIDKQNSTIERSVVSYQPWDENDPFVFNPFLPLHVNVVPQENQLVKLIFWDIENSALNREYMAGPFVNSYDTAGQSIDTQLQMTSRGVRVKKAAKIKNNKGEVLDPNTKGVVTKPEDVSIHGNHGSDIIFTNNGVVLRAGILDDVKSKKTSKPIAETKPGKFQLKKYDTKVSYVDKEKIVNEYQHMPVSTLVEYKILNIESTGTFDGELKVYNIINYTSDTDTKNFTENTVIESDNLATLYTISFTGLTYAEMARDINKELRKIDMMTTQKELNEQFYVKNIHPFFYRPNKTFVNSITGSTAIANAEQIFKKINLGTNKTLGLSYSRIEKSVPYTSVKKIVKEQVNENTPTTLTTALSDILFLLSYEANVPNDVDKINFVKLDNYEMTQEQLVQEVLPKTFSLLRGEPTIYLLELMVKWMLTHIHNPAEVGITPVGLQEELLKELQSAKEKIINQKLRIN